MRTSENLSDLLSALAKAQGEFTNPERNRTVEVRTRAKGDREAGKYSFTYATFDAIIEMARPILTKHGLAFVQSPETREGNVSVTTRLGHASGQWLESDLAVSLGDDDGPQQIGSCITYLKRYSLCSMLGIAAEEDDDGNAASGNSTTAKEREPMPTCPKCNESKGVIKGKEEYGGGWVCFAKKGGCGHKWQGESKAEPPKTNGEKRDAANPVDAARSAIERCTWEQATGLIDQIADSKKIANPDDKDILLDELASRVIAIRGDNDADPLMSKILARRKELSHTFA